MGEVERDGGEKGKREKGNGEREKEKGNRGKRKGKNALDSIEGYFDLRRTAGAIIQNIEVRGSASVVSC